MKEQLDGFRQKETEQKKKDELQHQRRLMEEQAAVDRRREQEKEEAKNREREREEQWHSKKLEMKMEMANKRTEEGKARLQSVKLQKYTITPFKGDYKDWLHNYSIKSRLILLIPHIKRSDFMQIVTKRRNCFGRQMPTRFFIRQSLFSLNLNFLNFSRN